MAYNSYNQGGYNQGGGGGGYNQGGPPGGGYNAGGFQPAPTQDPLWNWFKAVDRDNSGNISPVELQQALVNGDWTPFDLDTVKLLMSIFDTDRSGTVTFSEFQGLWKYIKDWQGVFRHFDADRSGSIDGRELQNALAQFGFNLNPQLLTLVERKYDLKAAVGGPAGNNGITFDRFVRCCVVIKQLTEAFQRLDTQRSGWVQMNYDTFMQTVLQLP